MCQNYDEEINIRSYRKLSLRFNHTQIHHHLRTISIKVSSSNIIQLYDNVQRTNCMLFPAFASLIIPHSSLARKIKQNKLRISSTIILLLLLLLDAILLQMNESDSTSIKYFINSHFFMLQKHLISTYILSKQLLRTNTF